MPIFQHPLPYTTSHNSFPATQKLYNTVQPFPLPSHTLVANVYV